MHNEMLHDLYFSPSIIRVISSRTMRWTGSVARMGEKINLYRVLVGKPEGRRPLGRRRHGWEDSIEWIFKEMGLDWINLA